MTISDARIGTAGSANDMGTAATEGLQQMIFGPAHIGLHLRMRDTLIELDDRPRPDLSHAAEAARAPALLREALAALGVSVSDLAADAHLRGALCDWAQVLTPRLLLILTGQIVLSTRAIRVFGDGSDYQRDCLADLDTGTATGGLALTELDGTNGNDHQTTASWDGETGGFWLNSPGIGACKYMPNVADEVGKIFVVTARLHVDGDDEGVLPFLVRLRDSDGRAAEGVRIFRLPEKTAAAMDHALIRFDRVWVPREALLGGTWAQMTEAGRLECSIPPAARFGKVVEVLSRGRLDLATAAAASARAGIAGVVNYAAQRRSGGGTVMLDRDNIGRDLMPAVAATYATSVLGRKLREMAATTPDDPRHTVLAMLAKPLLSYTAHEVLTMCRWRSAGQGILRSNRIPDWNGNLKAIITAEGENQILQVTATRTGIDLNDLHLPGTPGRLPWYVDVLTERAQIIGEGLAAGNHTAAGVVLGRNSAAIQYSTATAERLAVTALIIAADDIHDPTARHLGLLLAEAYALDRIAHHGLWYTARRLITAERAAQVEARLVRTWSLLRDALPLLTAAFAIPALPGAPLFAPDYKAELAAAVTAVDPEFFTLR